MSLYDLLHWMYYTPLLEVVFYLALLFLALNVAGIILTRVLGTLIVRIHNWAQKHKGDDSQRNRNKDL